MTINLPPTTVDNSDTLSCPYKMFPTAATNAAMMLHTSPRVPGSEYRTAAKGADRPLLACFPSMETIIVMV